MTEQEGGKPLLSIVPPVDTNLPEITQSYSDITAGIIATLSSAQAKGETLDVRGALRVLDPEQDNSTLRDYLAKNNMLARPAFERILAGIARNRTITDELGFLPTDALDYVTRYAEAHKVRVTTRGTLTRARRVKVGDDYIDATNCDQSPHVRLLWDVANATGADLDSFARELRLTNGRLNLGYPDSQIADAVSEWRERSVRQIKSDTLAAVQHERGRATGPAGEDMWKSVERACFDVSQTKPGFAIAVLQKFIWQVKRKGRGLPVTNHLMPVLTGAQGKGKTQFVKQMTAPLRELMREVDFGLLTDGKTKDIWSSLILFIDEMGFFRRADVDQVKNLITTDSLSIRTMRSNDSTMIANCATLIGCSNKSLGQLIRDETGVRRFAELAWRNDPDWEASNAVDWMLLWQSVDETGPDPLSAAGMTAQLAEQQEGNRNRSPVEVWARENQDTLGSWTTANKLFGTYRDWEVENFPRHDTNVINFGRTLTNLIETIADFPMEKRRSRTSVEYRSKP